MVTFVLGDEQLRVDLEVVLESRDGRGVKDGSGVKVSTRGDWWKAREGKDVGLDSWLMKWLCIDSG